jgi:hypothetical protein
MAGILSTAAMTVTEMPSWKRWGIYGIFEWHENYIITKRLHRRFSNTIEKGAENHFKAIFFFHFLNGALAAIAFPYVITFLIPLFLLTFYRFLNGALAAIAFPYATSDYCCVFSIAWKNNL